MLQMLEQAQAAAAVTPSSASPQSAPTPNSLTSSTSQMTLRHFSTRLMNSNQYGAPLSLALCQRMLGHWLDVDGELLRAPHAQEHHLLLLLCGLLIAREWMGTLKGVDSMRALAMQPVSELTCALTAEISTGWDDVRINTVLTMLAQILNFKQ